MAPNSNLHNSTGLPVCVSGIIIPQAFSREIADHDRRRKVFKKMKTSWVRQVLDEDQEIRSSTQRSHERIVGDIEGDDVGDLAGVLHDLCCSITMITCTAKAA